MATTADGAAPIGVFERREPLGGLDPSRGAVEEVLVHPDGATEGIVPSGTSSEDGWAVVSALPGQPLIGLPAGASGDVSRARRTALVLLTLDTDFTDPESTDTWFLRPFRGCR